VLLATFACTPPPCTGPTRVGPITAAPTLTIDETNKVWLFFGTGRYYSTLDKTSTDLQHFFGVKDPVPTGLCLQASVSACERNDLVDVSSASVCVVCTGGTTQVTGVTGVTTLTGSTTATLQGLVASKDGWWTSLPTARERAVVSPTLVGGIVFFPTFIPSDDLCSASGSSTLYALFYLTGSAYKESVIGTAAVGADTTVQRSTNLGVGLSSQMAVHIGAQDTDSANNITGRVTVCGQSSTGALTCTLTNPPLAAWSGYRSWNDQKT
jgi:type IV pilus assembly protein PilY1